MIRSISVEGGSERVVRSISLWNKYCGTSRGNGEQTEKTNLFLRLERRTSTRPFSTKEHIFWGSGVLSCLVRQEKLALNRG